VPFSYRQRIGAHLQEVGVLALVFIPLDRMRDLQSLRWLPVALVFSIALIAYGIFIERGSE
jgi:hypothetical protein